LLGLSLRVWLVFRGGTGLLLVEELTLSAGLGLEARLTGEQNSLLLRLLSAATSGKYSKISS